MITMFEVIYITTPCRLVCDSNHFGKTYCLLFQGTKDRSRKFLQNRAE